MQNIRWGIIGAGNIARSFAQDVQLLPDTEVLAVGSRSVAKAQQFAAELRIPRSYGSYEELAADSEVDVVYIATPHVFHKEQSILCLNAGKPVLVEKPFTMTAVEAQEVVDCARDRGLFCMEAMWMRFIPAMRQAVRLVQDGVIGEVQMISASLGFYNEFASQHRLFNPDLGGGAMLDLGIYPLSLIYQLLGQPISISSQATIGQSQVDEQAAVILGFAEGQIATLSTNLRAANRNDAFIIGATGSIHVHTPIYRPTIFTINEFTAPISRVKTGSIAGRIKKNPLIRQAYQTLTRLMPRLEGTRSTTIPYVGNGYGHEAAEVIRCLRAGYQESDVMPLNETIAIMRVMDTIRADWISPN